MKTNVVRKRVRTLQHLASLFRGPGVVDDQLNPLMPCQIANDFSVDPWDRFEPARPIAVIVRPCQPCGSVRLPLGGHAVAERSGGRFDRYLASGMASCRWRHNIPAS